MKNVVVCISFVIVSIWQLRILFLWAEYAVADEDNTCVVFKLNIVNDHIKLFYLVFAKMETQILGLL